jgi:hypothetical protein
MKIAGNSRIRTPAAGKAARSAGSQAFSVPSSPAPAATEASAPVTTTSSVTAVDALLAVQEVPNEREGQKRALKRGNDMLDLLDDIRIGLLTGLVPKARLVQLLHVVEERKDKFVDPRLSLILDEIELRARVELVKFESSLN